MEYSQIEREIIYELEHEKEGLSTYMLAKKTGIRWGTIITHCYKLESQGLVKSQRLSQRIGAKTKILWKLVEKKVE